MTPSHTQTDNGKIRRGRPKLGGAAKTSAVRVRLTSAEKTAFGRAASKRGVTPTDLLRRAVREVITSGPALFDDELGPLIDANNQIAALGRNINQIARTANVTGIVDTDETKELLEAVRKELSEQTALLQNLIINSRKRSNKLFKTTR